MTVKVRAEMMKEFTEGKTSSWDPEAEFKSWEKMKTLYSKFEGKDEPQAVAFVKPTEPSKEKGGASRSGVLEDEVVVEYVEWRPSVFLSIFYVIRTIWECKYFDRVLVCPDKIFFVHFKQTLVEFDE